MSSESFLQYVQYRTVQYSTVLEYSTYSVPTPQLHIHAAAATIQFSFFSGLNLLSSLHKYKQESPKVPYSY
jgi:hypothetical protein